MMSDLNIVLTVAVSAICLPSLTVHGDSSLYVSRAVMTSNTTNTAQQQNNSQSNKEQTGVKMWFCKQKHLSYLQRVRNRTDHHSDIIFM